MTPKPQRLILILLFTLLIQAGCQPDTPIASDTLQLQINAHLEVAELYRQQGQYRAAEIEGFNALRLRADAADTRSFMARLYYEMGDLNNAKNYVATLYAAEPSNIDIALLMAELEYRSGNSFRAESILGRIRDANFEQNQQAALIRGNISALREDFEAAREAFESIITVQPDHIDALIAASRLELSVGNLEQAQIYTEQASAIAPENLDLLLWQGQLAMLTRQYEQAEEFLFEALDAMADYDTMTSRRFSVLQSVQAVLTAQQKNDEALRYAELIAASPQGQYLAGFEQALSLYQQGDYEQAETAIVGLLAINPNDVDSQALMGMTRYAQQDYVAAGEILSSLVNTESATPQAIRSLAAVYLRQNQPARAIDTLASALTSFPRDATLLSMLGISHQAAGEFETSSQYLEESLSIDPEDPRTLYALAQTQYLQQDLQAAIETLDQLLRLSPDFVGAKTSLIGIYLAQEEFAEARARAQDWLDKAPNSAVHNVIAGWVAFIEESYQEATQLFETTLRIDPDNSQAQLFLARIHLLSENYLAALAQYEELLATAPDNIEAISGYLAAGALAGTVEESTRFISNLAEANPANYLAPLLLSQFYQSQGDLESSRSWAEIAWGREANESTRSNLVNNYAAAITAEGVAADMAINTILDDAIASPQEILSALRSLTRQEINSGDFDRAQRVIRAVKSEFPDAADGYELEGDLLFEDGDPMRALEAYRAAWAKAHNSTIGSKLHFTLTSLDRLGDAQQFLDSWITELPDDGAANLLTGINHLAAGNEEAALSHFQVAYQKQPTNPIVLNNLAWLYRNSDLTQGIQLAREAVDYRPEYVDGLDTLGWLLHLNGQSEEAVEYLTRAVELAPTATAINEHLQTVSAAL